MKCNKCGALIPDWSKACPNCGEGVLNTVDQTSVQPAQPQAEQPIEQFEDPQLSQVNPAQPMQDQAASVQPSMQVNQNQMVQPEQSVLQPTQPTEQPMQQISQPMQQPMQPVQQPMQPQQIDQAQLMQNSKKSSNGLVTVVIVFTIISVLGVALFISTSGGKNLGSGNSGSSSNGNNSNNSNNSGNNNGSNVATDPNATTFEFKGYTFTLPSYATASKTDEYMLVLAHDNSVALALYVQSGNFDSILQNKDQITTILAQQENASEYDLSGAITEEKTYGGVPFIVTRNVTKGTYNLDLTYGKADSNAIYIASITKSDGSAPTENDRSEMYGIVASGSRA